MNNEDFMTGYEKRIIRGSKKTQADLLKDNKMLSNTVKECLGVEVEKTLDSGEVVNVPIMTVLVAKKIGFLMDHPEKIDLKELSSVMGEAKTEVDIESTTATEMFRGITAGANNHGSDPKQSE